MSKRSHFSVILEVQNGLTSDHRMEHEILQSIGLGDSVPAGYFKTIWVKGVSETDAIECAVNSIRCDADELPFIENETVVVDSISPCSWWTYFRNKNQTGRTFYGFEGG